MTLAVEHEVVPLVGTRSGRQNLKNFTNADVGPSKSLEDANERPTKQPSDKEKQKELRYNRALQKDATEELSSSFHFDVLAQLASILVRITLYELFHLSKTTRDALKEVLADRKFS